MGSGFRTFQSGEVLTSSNVQNYLMDQAVTVFAGTAARGSAIASPETGMVSYRTDGTADSKREGFEFYDGSGWVRMIPAPTGGLVLISATTIGSAVSAVTVSDAFSSTYDNYLITVSGGVASTNNSLVLTLGATVTGYYYSGSSIAYSATTYTGTNGQNAANWGDSVRGSTNSLNGQIFLYGPNLAKNTHFSSIGTRSDTGGGTNMLQGYLANTTQYTAFTLTTNTGTVTGGTIRVYGFQNS